MPPPPSVTAAAEPVEVDRLAALAASMLSGHADESEVFQRIASYARRLLASDWASVVLVGSDTLWVKASAGFAMPATMPRTNNPSLDPIWRGETLIIDDITEDPRFAYTHRAFPHLRSIALAPLTTPEGQTLAFIGAGWSTRQRLGPTHVADLQQLVRWLLQELDALHRRHALDEVEADLSALMNAVSDPVWMVDEENRVMALNAACVRMAEMSGTRIPYVGMTTGDILPPPVRAQWDRAIAEAFAGRTTRLTIEWAVPGRTLPLEIFYQPVYHRGRVVRALGLLRDLSATRDLSEHARSQERLFRAVAENSLDTICIVDRAGRMRWLSPAVERTFGFSPEELFGKPFVELLSTHEREHHEQKLAALLREAGKTNWDAVRMRHKDGTTRQVESRSVSLIDDPVIAGVLVVLRDLTDEQRARYVEDVITTQENERRRIARELHDSTGQTLISLLVNLSTLEKRVPSELKREFGELRQLTSSAADEVGRLAKGLHLSVLDDHGLPAALERLAESFAASGLKIDTQLVGFLAHERLPSALETTLYRVAQESLTNVVKHARATTVSLTVDWRGSEVRLVVEDDGCGFDTSAVSRGRHGLGVRGIYERVALVRGQVTIESLPGRGTAIYVRVPVI